MWDVIDALCAGLTQMQISRALAMQPQNIAASMAEIANRVPGHVGHSRRERILFWRGKQIGVSEFFAGLRDARGFPIVERDLPTEHPDSIHHAEMFPEIR